MKQFLVEVLLVVTLVLLHQVLAQSSNCNFQKVMYPVTPSRYVYQFECFSPTPDDPALPLSTTNPYEFNEVDLSPNTYTNLPLSSGICLFNNTYLLDLSFNKLTSLTGIFKQLVCLKFLRTLDLSNNRISSQLSGSDFDDSFVYIIQTLDLSENLIPSISSDVFIKGDNTTRFPYLRLLDVSKNRLKTFDLLWPLVHQYSLLSINFDDNPIDTLNNPLNRAYNDIIFAYPMNASRSVSIRNSLLKRFDDSNLLQYGLKSLNDFEKFWSLIANYDFNQSTRLVNCTGACQQTQIWYKGLTISRTNPIDRLYCANLIGFVPVLGFNCQTTTTTTITTTTTTTTRTTSTTNTPLIVTGDIQFQVTSNSDTNYYYLFFLLFIPLIIFLLILGYFCCYGRKLNLCLTKSGRCFVNENKSYSYENEQDINQNIKLYDALFLYSQNDKEFVDKTLKPYLRNSLNHQETIHFLIMPDDQRLTESQKAYFTRYRRIFIIFNKNDLDYESDLATILKEIYLLDPVCVIVLLGYNNSLRERIEDMSERLEDDNPDHCYCFSLNMTKTVRHNTRLNKIETLIWSQDTNFSTKFNYLLLNTASFNKNGPALIEDKGDEFNILAETKVTKLVSKKRNNRGRESEDFDSAGYRSEEVRLPPIDKRPVQPRISKNYARLDSETDSTLFSSRISVQTDERGKKSKKIKPFLPQDDETDNKLGISLPRTNINAKSNYTSTVLPIESNSVATKKRPKVLDNNFNLIPPHIDDMIRQLPFQDTTLTLPK